VGNCYIFNPANGVMMVTLNNVDLGPVPPADASSGYSPQSIVATTSRYDEGQGNLSIRDPNTISISYLDDPQRMFGPYVAGICFQGGVSVDDDLILYAGRLSPTASGPASVVVMNTGGSVLPTRCSPGAALPKGGGGGAA